MQEGASHETSTAKKPMHASLCGRAFRVAAVGLCRATTRESVRRWGAPRWPWSSRAPAGDKTSRPIHRTIAWGRLAGDNGRGGWGRGAHLDRRDQRYQRKKAPFVRRAGPVVVAAVAVGVYFGVLLRHAALLPCVAGGPAGIAGQDPAVLLPVGAVLGEFLGPGMVRGHAKPAGVTAPDLPNVSPAAILTLISEHAAAEDADAVEGVPILYDRRHMRQRSHVNSTALARILATHAQHAQQQRHSARCESTAEYKPTNMVSMKQSKQPG